MKKIPITKNKFALVDDEDYDFIMQWKWCFDGRYAVRNSFLERENGKQKYNRIYMHRLINKTPTDMNADHINGDKLDNRKENLRSATCSQNQWNRKSSKKSSSEYKGVHWNKRDKRWIATLRKYKKTVFQKYFLSEKEAAISYNEAAIKFHGEFARLNNLGES